MLKPFAAMLEYGRPSPSSAHWVEISQAMFNGIQRVLAAQQEPQAAMDQANEEIQELLDN